MERLDLELAELLQFENVAWYENGKLRIMDRRIYPVRKEFVICETYQQAAQAITDMVTQSLGPTMVVEMGMALAAKQATQLEPEVALQLLRDAVEAFAAARPTTRMKMRRAALGAYQVAQQALRDGTPADEAVFIYALEQANWRYARAKKVVNNLMSLLPKEGDVLTQCFAESTVGFMFQEMQREGRNLRAICTETRPFFQGSRLTASVARDEGVDVTVICDNMVASTMQTQNVVAFTCGADVIALDGSVINKVGTFQMAICADRLGVPMYVTGFPDPSHEKGVDVVIENRDANLILSSMDLRIAKHGIQARYPAFDCTPPELVRAIVTDKGVYRPEQIRDYLKD